MTLQGPSVDFSSLDLPVIAIGPARLFRISRHKSGEPHFGKSGLNRYDDPRHTLAPARRFGTCYFGLTLQCAFAETVLHDRVAHRGAFSLPLAELDRQVVRFTGTPLQLANLTGAHLKRLGADGSLSTILPYDLPQACSLAVHDHPAKVDGFLYVSRHLNNECAVVVFDRTRKRFAQSPHTTPLTTYPGSADVFRLFRIQPY
ncbi:RES family NAD+ phosphorylase [Pollutimonas bauzanensis]|uniref:RES domain-containing protein n=1 Tax=Pollutimonas bauzanensis TaxID=658167 RepID=A0A1M5MU46_9BURK|nr:RES family NAD+ phosphorylase [Pollutimonas bauzanensis]SHG80828.1 RES domain-containing protein [Pollutimonas bauzanensis]